MPTTVLHVCDKCKAELRMSDSGSEETWGRWMTAEVKLATDKVTEKDKGIFRLLWCKKCFEEILQGKPIVKAAYK